MVPRGIREVEPLVAVNDARLEALIRAEGEEEAEAELGRVIVGVVRPLAVNAFMSSRQAWSGASIDLDDIVATVSARIVPRLRLVRRGIEDSIESIDRYVATLTYNAVNDELRRRYPARTRLKNRLRYLLKHDRRLARWTTSRGVVAAGLRGWAGREDVVEAIDALLVPRTSRALDASRPAEAIVEILEALGTPASIEALLSLAEELWSVEETPHVTSAYAASGDIPMQLERREFAQALWREVRALRPLQRKALLLNLRDGEAVNVLSLFVLTGVTAFAELAAAVEMTSDELAAIWNDLPFDDLRIASMLGVTRQQVINLRKAARKRLKRRLE
jgi:DNA-binding transcriptional ArsR family regulator